MSDLDWIKNRLPAEHGFTDEHITEVLLDPAGANTVREYALADLLEELASQDRYKTISIGSTSYSDPLLMERARIWRSRAPVANTGEEGPGTIIFVPIKGRTSSYDEFGG